MCVLFLFLAGANIFAKAPHLFLNLRASFSQVIAENIRERRSCIGTDTVDKLSNPPVNMGGEFIGSGEELRKRKGTATLQRSDLGLKESIIFCLQPREWILWGDGFKFVTALLAEMRRTPILSFATRADEDSLFA